MTHTDIAIIGGGLVGASMACALAPLISRYGLDVTVIEPSPMHQTRQPQLSFDDRSSAIAYGSRRCFESLGVWEGMQEKASPITSIHVSQRGYLGVTRLSCRDTHTEALGYVIGNRWMGHVLHQRLAELPISWRCPASVQHIVPNEGGHCLTLDDGSTLNAALTIMADGGRSGLKSQLGIKDDVTTYEQHALIANVTLSMPHQGVAYERFTPDGPIALLPLQGRKMALVWTRTPEALKEVQALSDARFLDQLQRCFGDRVGRFVEVGQRMDYPLALRQAREQTRPHLAMLGNAAHTLHPVAGQGFNLALRGVKDLTLEIQQALEQGEAVGSASVMGRFEARRQQDRDQIIRFSDGLVRLFGVEHPLLAHARGLGLIGMNLLSPARRLLTRRAMGL